MDFLNYNITKLISYHLFCEIVVHLEKDRNFFHQINFKIIVNLISDRSNINIAFDH